VNKDNVSLVSESCIFKLFVNFEETFSLELHGNGKRGINFQ